MRDYESNDVETAAALAAEDAEPDYDRPTRAEAEWEAECDEFGCHDEDVLDAWALENGYPVPPVTDEEVDRWMAQEAAEEALEGDESDTEEYTGSECPLCGADLQGGEEHDPTCPVTGAS